MTKRIRAWWLSLLSAVLFTPALAKSHHSSGMYVEFAEFSGFPHTNSGGSWAKGFARRLIGRIKRSNPPTKNPVTTCIVTETRVTAEAVAEELEIRLSSFIQPTGNELRADIGADCLGHLCYVGSGEWQSIESSAQNPLPGVSAPLPSPTLREEPTNGDSHEDIDRITAYNPAFCPA